MNARATDEIDGATLAAARRRDRDAFTVIVHQYERRLRVLAYQILQDPSLTEDAVQDAFVAAYCALPRFRGDAALGTWLHRITYNACAGYLRRAAHTPLPTGDPRTIDTVVVEDHSGAVVRRSEVAKALAALSADQRFLVLLIDRDGFDYKTAARLLEVPRGTIASRLSAARAALRAALAAPDETPAAGSRPATGTAR